MMTVIGWTHPLRASSGQFTDQPRKQHLVLFPVNQTVVLSASAIKLFLPVSKARDVHVESARADPQKQWQTGQKT